MKLLLDSHTLIWSVDNPSKLSTAAAAAIQNPANDRHLSAATIWEIAIKVGSGKLTLSLPYRQWMNKAKADLNLSILPITIDYGDRLTTLPYHHRDPFDRILIAQAFVEGIDIVSADPHFDPYGIKRLW